MTRFQKILAVLATALLLAPAAGFAQTKSLDDLLKEVRTGRRAVQRLPHILRQGLVRELAYTGRRMAAAEALPASRKAASIKEASRPASCWTTT